ncbi:MAG: hypothetical protein WC337_01035, partial [Candidatus Muiribacteriota bacterium]
PLPGEYLDLVKTLKQKPGRTVFCPYKNLKAMDPGIKHRRGDSKKHKNITKKTSLRIAGFKNL